MTPLQIMTAWLQTFPLWDGLKLCVDYVDSIPECAGLYPEGLEEISRQRDILGNVTVHNRLHFVLYRLCAGDADGSSWLLLLQQWLQQQSMAGLAPCFGDDPGQERLFAHKGKLQWVNQTGTEKYAVNITAEFIKKQEGDM